MKVREVALGGRRVVRVVAYELSTGEAEPLRRVLIAPAWQDDPTLLGEPALSLDRERIPALIEALQEAAR